MVGDKWIIHWDDYMANAYTYGSQVTFFSNGDVEYINRLVPSGTVLKKWYSKTSYQLMGIEPTLPIIDGEATYKLMVDIDMMVEEGIIVKIVFYNKYDVEVGNLIIRGKEQIFRCPLATYCYEVVLLSAGADSFRFHSFTIQEVADESKEHIKKAKKRLWKSKKIQK